MHYRTKSFQIDVELTFHGDLGGVSFQYVIDNSPAVEAKRHETLSRTEGSGGVTFSVAQLDNLGEDSAAAIEAVFAELIEDALHSTIWSRRGFPQFKEWLEEAAAAVLGEPWPEDERGIPIFKDSDPLDDDLDEGEG